MGTYINIGNAGFQRVRNSEYIDKSGLISVINGTLFTERSFSCVSRCRRFGKSMAAKMLCAYYDRSCDSRKLFEDLQIAQDPSFEKHLNKYPVIYLDMSDFTERFKGDDIVERIKEKLREDIIEAYPQVRVKGDDDLMEVLVRINEATGDTFILIVDEWDALCREFPSTSQAMDNYVGWMRRMFKSVSASRVFAAVYMTGILPIKKYNTQSALNNFLEYSMVEPRQLARFFGFTKEEVRMLAERHGTDFDELVKWYDGYQIGDELSMFNPNSVIQAVAIGRCRSFWASTGAF
ncbi:MAG: AAA family ATPase, partial [Bacteroidaceae bacterium]|nr:AAA family ATPase [Bacteroidaceae bacterium]